MAGSSYYNYAPSSAAAIVFVFLFAINTLIHLWRMIRSKAWFLIPFLIGGFCKFLTTSRSESI